MLADSLFYLQKLAFDFTRPMQMKPRFRQIFPCSMNGLKYIDRTSMQFSRRRIRCKVD